jgi:hypothetical protein
MTTKKNTLAIKDEQAFAATLATIKGNLGDVKKQVQDCVLYGLNHFAQHSGDTSNLSRVLQVVDQQVGKMMGNTLKGYIQAHANVQWRKVDDGTHKFKKIGKGIEVKQPEAPWYEFKGANGRTQPDFTDPIRAIKLLIERLKEKGEEGEIVPGREQYVADIEARLADVLQIADAPKEQLYKSPEAAAQAA